MLFGILFVEAADFDSDIVKVAGFEEGFDIVIKLLGVELLPATTFDFFLKRARFV
jgi:hypothetical protein